MEIYTRAHRLVPSNCADQLERDEKRRTEQSDRFRFHATVSHIDHIGACRRRTNVDEALLWGARTRRSNMRAVGEAQCMAGWRLCALMLGWVLSG